MGGGFCGAEKDGDRACAGGGRCGVPALAAAAELPDRDLLRNRLHRGRLRHDETMQEVFNE